MLPIEYVPILVLAVVALAIPIGILALAGAVGPSRPTQAKLTPYESGIRDITPAKQRVPVKFYVVAMLFIVFDVEAIFFYPWAVSLRDLGPAGFWDMVVFMIVLLVGFFYAWKKGALTWE